MPKRLTQLEIDALFLPEGYTVTKYVNSTRVEFTCPAGHDYRIGVSDWRRGFRCGVCSGAAVTEQSAKISASERGWAVHTRYTKSSAFMDFTCDHGHEISVTWNAFTRGALCPTCHPNKRTRLTREQVKVRAESAGFKLLGEYSKSGIPLLVECSSGHKTRISLSNITRKVQCSRCCGARIGPEDVEKEFNRRGFTLLTPYQNNNKVPLNYICPNGHRHCMTWNQFQKGVGCGYCSRKIVTHKMVETDFKAEGYTLLTIYPGNCKAQLTAICDNGHKFTTNRSNFQAGNRCPYCPREGGGFKAGEPATLYYLKFVRNSQAFYKIGITNRTVAARYVHEPRPYKILSETLFPVGSRAREAELRILRKHKASLYTGFTVLVNGNTELFTQDVLGLDKGA